MLQVTINTLAMRHMMRPFRPGDRLEDHAAPIGEVMQQLQTQLAEYRALKEQLAVDAAGITDRERGLTGSDQADNSSASSTSSSLLQFGPTNSSDPFNVDFGRAHT